jgi:hypothetical protein
LTEGCLPADGSILSSEIGNKHTAERLNEQLFRRYKRLLQIEIRREIFFTAIARELADNEPLSFVQIIDDIRSTSHKDTRRFWDDIKYLLKSTNCVASVEHRFQGDKRADVAFFEAEKLKLLIEVKEYDHLQPGTEKQMINYLAELRRRSDLGLIYIYRFEPQPEVIERAKAKIEMGQALALVTYNQVHLSLSKIDPRRGPIARLIVRYLEDIGVGIYQDIRLSGEDGKTAKFLLSQMLCFPHNNNLGKNQSDSVVRAGPELLKRLGGNMEALSEWVRAAPNNKIIQRRFNRRFYVRPKLDLDGLAKSLRKTEDVDNEEFKIDPFVLGGSLYFQASGYLRMPKLKGKDRRLSLEIGLGIQLSKGGKTVRTLLYTSFTGYGVGGDVDYDTTGFDSGYFKGFPSEARAREELRKLLIRSRDKAKRNSIAAKILREFEIPKLPLLLRSHA